MHHLMNEYKILFSFIIVIGGCSLGRFTTKYSFVTICNLLV